MAGLVLCEPTDLYNILNQYTTRVSKLSESNYLCLIDARTKAEYDESHVFTAKRAKRDENGEFVIPACVEVECVKYCIVYDGNTSSVHGCGPAVECAEVLALSTRYPVQILKGGYEDFSASYPFLRTQKILYTPQELENLTLYPVEILPGQLYMANLRQASDHQIHKDLKLKALVNASQDSSHV
nr:PREDICTED: serine/threonine/tyrosine-interacting-like protein 1 [Lepisosteus oculatus]XP_015223348.1 PREDICTED: serine/threonine/tyrosine-interacting-like protein 1 [Lepisosteus oculatus]XP_015223350.1 PREDICTED: serine/threonine/tyrosine-interacting-like protein 1 [Lepisosteus oculatus]